MRVIGVILAGAFLFVTAGAHADTINSIQLVGNFGGITCDPADPDNDMEHVGDGVWQKLKYIDEPSDPDTIYLKFTMNGSFFPSHWGWSGVWGVAELDYDPPAIVAILDGGYYIFSFNENTYEYSIERPTGSIDGKVTASDLTEGAPEDVNLTLLDVDHKPVGNLTDIPDSLFEFPNLPSGVYSIVASAPGYRDTTVNGINLSEGGNEWVSIRLSSMTAVFISRAACTRSGGMATIRWTIGTPGITARFDIYRGTDSDLNRMHKRNEHPVGGSGELVYTDRCENPGLDYYYYLVEIDDDNPTRYGPILAAMEMPGAGSSIGQNYPNPFNPSTAIPFTVGPGDASSPVRISFFDVSGRLVDGRDLGTRTVGDHLFHWNTAAVRGKPLPSGVYYCKLRIGKEVYTSKLILLR